MLLLRLYTDLSVCSAIVGASYAGAPCPGALVENLSKSQLFHDDFVNLFNLIQQIQSLFQIGI